MKQLPKQATRRKGPTLEAAHPTKPDLLRKIKHGSMMTTMCHIAVTVDEMMRYDHGRIGKQEGNAHL